MIQCKRVYDDIDERDGYRVLVDRLWPRGVRKDLLHADAWCKTLAPTSDLRQALHQGLIDFATFAQAYQAELSLSSPHIVAHLREIASRQTLTLLYASKERQKNHAIILAQFLTSGDMP